MRNLDPHIFVIFGASGDLTRRKLIPALYRVETSSDMDRLALLGVARTDMSDADFRAIAVEALVGEGIDAGEAEAWSARHVYYECSTGDGEMEALRKRIEELESEHGLPGNRVLYLSLPPEGFPTAIEQLGEAGLNRSAGWTRLVIEKPFGSDLASAEDLNRLVHSWFDEAQIYRIDHYLGKETVQNLLAFRFSNMFFESSWNRDRVAKVEITVAEELGIGRRAGYYDKAGVVRDMLQNHVMQLFSLVAMEPPHTFTASSIRSEKIQVLHSVAPIDPQRVVLGRYQAGSVGGEEVPGYLEEDNVPADSVTPTFIALRLKVNNWRWQGVPFYLRVGKRLPAQTTQIVVTFERPPVCLFHGVQDDCPLHQNVLILILQPDEGFELRFDVKAPGSMQLVSQRLHFDYAEAFEAIPEAYQTLILDIIQGDQTLFVHSEEVESSWRLCAPLLAGDNPVHSYPAGTWGPDAVDATLGRNGEGWVMRR